MKFEQSFNRVNVLDYYCSEYDNTYLRTDCNMDQKYCFCGTTIPVFIHLPDATSSISFGGTLHYESLAKMF